MLKMAEFGARAKFEISSKILENWYGVQTMWLYSPYKKQQSIETTDLILSPAPWFLKVKNNVFLKIER
jgi:hypothetical protein